VTTDTYTHVGDGRGAYRKVPNYAFVGEGRGSFDLEHMPIYNGRRMWRSCMFCLAFMLFVAALCILLYWKAQAPIVAEPEHSEAKVVLITTSPVLITTSPVLRVRPRYFCAEQTDAYYAEAAWRLADRDNDGQVSRNELILCEQDGQLTFSQLAALRTSDYSGDGVLSREEFVGAISRTMKVSQASWSEAKIIWCCTNENVGCSTRVTTTVTSLPFDCAAFTASWELGWSCDKKEWCCKHYSSVYCPRTSFQPYDCNAGFASWQLGWSESKQKWCCEHAGRACPTTGAPKAVVFVPRAPAITSLPYDCDAGLYHWARGWSEGKKRWCCDHAGRGCPTTTTLCPTYTTTTPVPTLSIAPFNCEEGWPDLAASWALEKQEWCCKHYRHGCPTTTPLPTTTERYDCQLGFPDAVDLWKHPKKVWCCEHYHRGCASEVPVVFATKTTTATSTTTSTTTVLALCSSLACPSGYERRAGANSSRCAAPACDAAKDRDTCCSLPHRDPPTRVRPSLKPSRALCSSLSCPEGWIADADKANHVCKGDVCAAMVDAASCCRQEVMTCDLNCYDEIGSATVVVLPGAQGAGGGAHVPGKTEQQCQQLCLDSNECEAIVFGQGKCYGKKDIHTSKCEAGGGFKTEIVRSRPWGKCVMMGDPHIIPYDRQKRGDVVDVLVPGEYVMIESSVLDVHARFGYTKRFPMEASMVGLALRGSLIQDHELVIEYIGPATGHKGFVITLDGKEILSDKSKDSDTFQTSDGVVRARYDLMDPKDFHDKARHTIGDAKGQGKLLPSYLFELKPDLRIYMLLGPDSMNTIIETRKLEFAQDGYCGNFNCDPNDDSAEELGRRSLAGKLSKTDSVFRFGSGKTPPSYQTDATGKVHGSKDCPKEIMKKAYHECSMREIAEQEACIFDVCAARDPSVATAENEIAALDEEVERDVDRRG